MKNSSADSLILGTAAGYHFGDVRVFLSSLRAHGFEGHCVLFASLTTREQDRMADAGAEVVPFEPVPELAHLSLNAYRYFLYLEYLKEHGPFERVLLSDVRDVLFQADPFTYPWPEGLCVTLEDRRMTIGICPYVTRWVTGHLGQQAWEGIRDKPISCSGTTVGDHAAMLDYLERMTSLMPDYRPGREMMAGFDQGIHNHLLHTGQLASVTQADNTGPILTLAYKQEDPPVDGQGRILNDKGEPAVIVHQYDRKSKLYKRIREGVMGINP